MKVTFDPERCTGHGRCYALAPDVFAPDDFGHCEVVVSEPTDAAHVAQARLGVDNCPERALAIDE